MSFSAVGSGRKRGPTLLETHKENSAATTIAARKIESLDNTNCVIELLEILAETISKGPNACESVRDHFMTYKSAFNDVGSVIK